jgi:putative acyl-CoA dehydrogenase
MRQVLADLALESEAATALFVRLAAAIDAGESDFLRLGVAAGKYWVCKRTPTVVGEALECLGGNGYVEESGMPRLFRESPLNSIWEGPGNVICLDVLRALRRDPASVDALFAELDLSSGVDPRLDVAIAELRRQVADQPDERAARRISGRIARCLQAALLVRTSPAAVSDAFVASRIAVEPAAVAGEFAAEIDVAAVLERAEVP